MALLSKQLIVTKATALFFPYFCVKIQSAGDAADVQGCHQTPFLECVSSHGKDENPTRDLVRHHFQFSLHLPLQYTI